MNSTLIVMLCKVGKYVFSIILGFVAVAGFSSEVSKLVNDIIKKENIKDNTVFNAVLWMIILIFVIKYI